MPEPLVTFLMPLKYYQEGFLRQALQSLQQQTCPDWRLLIIVEALDHAAFLDVLREDLRDARIELTIMEGRPFSGSINTGMRQARTQFVALFFADDLLADDAVRVLTESIRAHPHVDFFYSSRQPIDENGEPLGAVRQSPANFSLADFKWQSPVKHLMCWRREKGLAVGGIDESLIKAPDDYDFPWTMAEQGAVFSAVPECLYFLRDHCAHYRRTTHIPRSAAKRGVRMILRKHGVGLLARHFIVAKRFRTSLGQQSIYRNAFDRWLKERLGIDARRSWRRPNRPS